MYLLVAASAVWILRTPELDPCSDSWAFGSVRLQGGEETVQVSLPQFQLDAFRSMVEPDFELRRGPGVLDVHFKPSIAVYGLAASRTWNPARLLGSTSKPRLGRQSFDALARLAACPAVANPSGHLMIFAAFDEEAYTQQLPGVGRWWFRDGHLFENRTTAVGLAVRESMREGLAGVPLDLRLKEQLWAAYRDSRRYPKVF